MSESPLNIFDADRESFPDTDSDTELLALEDDNDSADLGAGEDDEILEDDSVALWPGDKGTLSAAQRDTVVALLKRSFISSEDKAAWKTLLLDRDSIEGALNNLYFTLEFNEDLEVAYASPARDVNNPFRTLVRDAANSREETLLLMYLRERHRAETADGQPVVFADVDAMIEYISRFRPSTATDVAGDTKKARNAIAALDTAGILVRSKDAGRYRVHRAIEALLPLTTLMQLLDAFRRHNSGTDGTGDEGTVTEISGGTATGTSPTEEQT